jgi:uncharacterized protein
MSSENLHENVETLGTEVINQRAKATVDDQLRGILEHNRDEEKEHMAMVLEWLRRHDAVLDKNLKQYLFTTEPVLEIEGAKAAGTNAAGSGYLGIGDLREQVKK